MTGPHDIRPDDPLVRWMVPVRDASAPEVPCRVDGTSVAWLGRAARPGERWITALGEDPQVVADLVQQLTSEHPVDGVTVPAAAFDLLPAHLRSPDPGR